MTEFTCRRFPHYQPITSRAIEGFCHYLSRCPSRSRKTGRSGGGGRIQTSDVCLSQSGLRSPTWNSSLHQSRRNATTYNWSWYAANPSSSKYILRKNIMLWCALLRPQAHLLFCKLLRLSLGSFGFLLPSPLQSFLMTNNVGVTIINSMMIGPEREALLIHPSVGEDR